MEKEQLWTIIGVAIVVGIVASITTASITGNVIKQINNPSGKYNLYTKEEIDTKLTNLGLRYLDPLSCIQKTVKSYIGSSFLSLDCGSDAVIGGPVYVGCDRSSGIPYQTGVAYLGNDNTGMPSQASYVCKRFNTTSTAQPDFVIASCCDIKKR